MHWMRAHRQIDVEIIEGGRARDWPCMMMAWAWMRKTWRARFSGMRPSKLPDLNLWNIQSRGFRGEALAAIGAVSRLQITSRTKSARTAHLIVVEGGRTTPVVPTSRAVGTSVEVGEIFFATPARLKFLKTVNAETAAVREVVERQALAAPHAGFQLKIDDRNALHYPAPDLAEENPAQSRVTQVMGESFMRNARYLSVKVGEMQLHGWITLPTHHRGTAGRQFFIVNG